ncbi:MAG: rRNA (pseudouridine1915-N3)-methyltransferase [Patescibacteria group bacterium]|nr:rRNA (pseudouridine1915-N3)-methyltransferase [Patescibacteria group bacterium]
MNIIIISPGKSKGYLGEDIVLEYTSRISHYSSIEWKFISAADIKEEGEKIVKAIPEKSFLVILDEKGKQLTSPGFSDFLNKRLNESTKNLVFVIGGAYGISDAVKEKAQFTWSLSTLVFPHELVRSILAEQMYRGFSILRGEKYHHE